MRVIVKQLLSALHYCHKLGVIHRDIKMQNVMSLDQNDITSLKLIDFGLSGKLSGENGNYRAMGTAIYIAPEMIMGEYDEKIDLWALGILIFYTMTGSPPFQGRTQRELYLNIIQGQTHRFVPSIPQATAELNDLLAKMLKYDKSERISAQNAIKHIWILLKSSTNGPAIKDFFLKNITSFLNKSKFLKLLSFQYSAKWRDAFGKPLKDSMAALDVDGDGIISKEEFISAIDRFNKSIKNRLFSRQEAEMIFANLDFNGNGQIDYLEFQTLFSSQMLMSDETLLFKEFSKLDLVD